MTDSPNGDRDPRDRDAWKRLEGQDRSLEANKLFDLRLRRYRSPSTGRENDLYVMEMNDGVSVVALTPDRKVVLVRQFRPGSEQVHLECPGGLVDPGEEFLQTARRELLEETGYAGPKALRLGAVYSNPAIMTMQTHICFVGDVQCTSRQNLDPGEEIEVELVKVDRVIPLIRAGQIVHATSVASLLWWYQSREMLGS